MAQFLEDLRYAARMYRRTPGFTAIAVLTLALGIGANTAIFTVLDAVLIRPLPFEDPDRLVQVYEDASFVSFPKNTPAPANFWDWKKRNRSFTDMAAMRFRGANLADSGSSEFAVGNATTWNLFSVLGVKPELGRALTAEDDVPGSRAIVISHGLWLRRYGADRSVIGKNLRVNGEDREIIGVMPKGFHFPAKVVDFWIPLGFTEKEWANRGQHFLTVVARLKPGTSLEAAQKDVSDIATQLRNEHPRSNAQIGAVVAGLRDEFTGDSKLALILLMCAAGAVLMIGCANLANLLLARATVRSREMAVRTALGAGQTRLIRQMLTESVLLSLVGGIAGLLWARLGLRVIEYLVPDRMVSFIELGLDMRLLVFSLGLALLTGIVFGVVPAWRISRLSLNEALKQGGRGDVSGRGQRLRQSLVVAEAALAVVLVTCSGLMIRTLINLHNVDLGFEARNLLTMRTFLQPGKYQNPQQLANFYDRVLRSVRALPGVENAAYGGTLPFDSIGNTNGYTVEGQTPEPGMDALYRPGTATYLQSLHARLKDGRLLDERDSIDAPRTVVVNETFVRRHFPDGKAVGKRLKYGGDKAPWMTIVGVIEDIRERGLRLEMKPATYVPAAQNNDSPSTLIVRGKGDVMALVPAIRQIIAEVDREQPIARIRTMEQTVEEASADRQHQMRLLVGLAALALTLAAIGLYGVLSYTVSQKTREIGLRMALGASEGSVIRMILSEGLAVTIGGTIIGGLIAVAVTQFMQNLLFGVKSFDPLVLSVSIGVLIVTGFIACTVPAHRASRVHPITALRDE